MTQIKTTTIDQLLESTDIENLSMFGYDVRKPAGSRSVRVPFGAIYPKFGISQQVGTAMDKAPSEAAVAAAIKQATPLASDTQNGLLSKEQNKFINDLIKEYPMIEEQLKLIAEAQTPYDDEILLFHTNTEPEHIIDGLRGEVKGKYRIETKKGVLNSSTDTLQSKSFGYDLGEQNAVAKISGDNIQSLACNLFKRSQLNRKLDKVAISSKNIKIIELTYLQFNIIDVINAPELYKLEIAECGVSDVNVTGAPKLTRFSSAYGKFALLDLSKNPLIETIYCSFNENLKVVTLPTSTTQLKDFSVRNSPNFTLDKIMTVGAAWADRTGKEEGLLRISISVYDTMTEEQKAVFTNKNIKIIAQ